MYVIYSLEITLSVSSELNFREMHFVVVVSLVISYPKMPQKMKDDLYVDYPASQSK